MATTIYKFNSGDEVRVKERIADKSDWSVSFNRFKGKQGLVKETSGDIVTVDVGVEINIHRKYLVPADLQRPAPKAERTGQAGQTGQAGAPVDKTLLSELITGLLSAGAEQALAPFKEFVAEQTAQAANGRKLIVKIGSKASEVEGLKHKSLEKLIKVAAQDLPVLLVGMAGTGKTHAAEQVAEALGVPFYAMSVGAQTSKADIIGYMTAGGEIVRSLFREAYENGGVFLMDEIDAGNSNVLIQINAALANHYCAFPDKMVKRHPDFRFIASANTFGFGASRMYVGRNQLDSATLDRFTVMVWDVDEQLETLLVGDSEDGKLWLKVVHELRRYVLREEIRALITPRATLRGLAMLEAGIPFAETLEMAVLNSIPTDKQAAIKQLAIESWSK
jgi:ribosomal protein L21E